MLSPGVFLFISNLRIYSLGRPRNVFGCLVWSKKIVQQKPLATRMAIREDIVPRLFANKITIVQIVRYKKYSMSKIDYSNKLSDPKIAPSSFEIFVSSVVCRFV